ncbi:MAG: GIY-YIG nuclease family protein [Opitutales bacterium]
MVTLLQFLAAAGLEVPVGRIKLVKHVDHPLKPLDAIVAAGELEFFQAEQKDAVRPFDGCEAIVSLLARPQNLAEFYGIFRVGPRRPLTAGDLAQAPEFVRASSTGPDGRIWYALEEDARFRPLRGRLVGQWRSTRGWYQRKDIPVHELRPEGASTVFPGFEHVLLSWAELKHIFAHPRAHLDWKAALASNAGIYRIVDTSTGEIYIGSAYGEAGLWGRWQTYAQTGHGNNQLLRSRDPAHFRWSIIRTVSRALSAREVIRLEALEKAKHGSRATGLNAN